MVKRVDDVNFAAVQYWGSIPACANIFINTYLISKQESTPPGQSADGPIGRVLGLLASARTILGRAQTLLGPDMLIWQGSHREKVRGQSDWSPRTVRVSDRSPIGLGGGQ